jgi:hypothetical protein
VNRKVTVPVGKDAEASRSVETLRSNPLSTNPERPIVGPSRETLGGACRPSL